MSLKHYPEVDESLWRETLENGLQIVVVHRPGFQKRLAYFVTDYGSVHTAYTLGGQPMEAPAGVAHYLEHKMFDLPDGRDVSAEFASLGASVNAFTSYDMTAYYFSCTENFSACLRLLLEFVSTPYFTPESVSKEQGIIGQEIGMNEDTPDTRVFENLMQILYREHPIRVPILGTRESISRITPQTLYDCHSAFYAPENMLLCVVGDVAPQAVTSLARQVLGSDTRPTGQKAPLPAEPMVAGAPLITTRMEVAMPMFQLAFKAEPLSRGEDAIRMEMIGDLAAEALFGESSELYLQLYEQGLIDSSFGGGFETIDGCAMLTCSGDSDDPEAVRDAILAQSSRLVQSGLAEDRFLRMKRSAMGRRIRDLDSFDSTCFRICAYHFSDFDYFRFPHIYRDIRPEDVTAFLRRVVTQPRCALSIIYPIQEETP